MKLPLLPFAVCGLVLPGCGGDESGAPQCPAESCGGDVVAAWGVAGQCDVGLGPEPAGDPECPEWTRDVSGLVLSGSLTVRSDGTYEESLATSGSFTDRVPLSCLLDGQSCETWFDDATCTTDGSDCECVVPFEGASATTGTWSVTGDSITFFGESQTHRADYCADANRLTLWFREGGREDGPPFVLDRDP